MEKGGKGAVHVPPGEGKALWMSGGTYTLKATSEDTGGSLLVMEAIVPLEGGPRRTSTPAWTRLSGSSRGR